jgi:hypothetical protein
MKKSARTPRRRARVWFLGQRHHGPTAGAEHNDASIALDFPESNKVPVEADRPFEVRYGQGHRPEPGRVRKECAHGV